MNLVKTKSFELAIYAKGDPASSKLAIVVPGRLDTKDYFHNISLVDFLAARGYFALSFDPPGTWESPGGIDLYTTTNCIKVVHELIEHFENKPTVLAGHSRGGTIAMLAGPKNPYVSHIIPIFSYYGAPSDPEPERVVDGKLISYRDLPPGTSRTEEQKKFELPLEYFKDGAQYNALAELSHYAKPKLFFYGTQDAMNLPEHVKEAFEKSAEPKEIHAIDSEHDYRLIPEVVTEVNAIIGNFLDNHPE
jgi:hypothetical protein